MRQAIRCVAIAVAIIGMLAPGAGAQELKAALGSVSVADYANLAKDVGKETEDWHPAFVKALEVCATEGRPLLVPAGTYRIHKAIDVPHRHNLKGFHNPSKITIRGEGRMQTTIQQMVETENVLNWSGPEYRKSLSGGMISDIALSGGKTCLDIKWHNQFNLRDCYIAGAKEYGIYTEGYSSRFSNSIIRWCAQAGIRGRAHFNDIVIRDLYMSRHRIGIQLSGGNGVRIVGCAFEHCHDSAVVIENHSSVTVRDCYFENNAREPFPKPFGTERGATFPHTIFLDNYATNVVVESSIFRGGRGCTSSNQIGIVSVVNGSIRNNRFTNVHNAIMLLEKSPRWTDHAKRSVEQLVVTENDLHVTDKVKGLRKGKGLPEAPTFLAEEKKGLIEAAKAKGCVFETPTHSNIGSTD